MHPNIAGYDHSQHTAVRIFDQMRKDNVTARFKSPDKQTNHLEKKKN